MSENGSESVCGGQSHRRDYKHTWYKANRKRTVHSVIDEYIKFIKEDGDM